MKRIELTYRRLEIRRAAGTMAFRGHAKRLGAIIAAGIAVAFSVAGTSMATELPIVGNCTPGEAQCQVNEVAVCECYEEWRETPDGDTMAVAVCGWEFTGDSCGGEVITVPDCTPNRRGAEVRFADDVIKTCRCYGEDNCSWE